MRNHVSVRDFAPGTTIDDSTLKEIIDAGRDASTWRSLQSYSIIIVRDQATKDRISELISQPSIKNCAAFLVFVGDLARAKTAVEMQGGTFQPDLVEALLVTSVDASICAQNTLLAAESLGLGGCYIGTVRNASAEISDILGLSDYQYPLVGMVLGVPAKRILPKPRMRPEGVVFYERYDDDDAVRATDIKNHEADLVDYPDPRPMTFSERQNDQWGKPGQTSTIQNLRAHGFPA
jgi:nitroreductase